VTETSNSGPPVPQNSSAAQGRTIETVIVVALRDHSCPSLARARYDRSKLRYPSDLTDDECELVEPLIPPGETYGDHARVVNGFMYILSTGCQWCAVPKDLPLKSSVYDYCNLWTYDGTLAQIRHALYEQCRERAQREATVRTH
jgi:transposase